MKKVNNELIIALLYKRLKQESMTPGENDQLDNWVSASEANKQLYDEITNGESLNKLLDEFAALDVETSLAQVKQRIANDKIVQLKRRRIVQFVAAACILIIPALGIYLFNQQSKEDTTIVNKQEEPASFTNQIPPGGDKARLTLSNGSITIDLDSSQHGPLAIEESAIKHGEKLLFNIAKATNAAGEITLSIPRGLFLQVLLPDKSSVWLNSVSSLRIKDLFKEKTRRVELTGEGYFEIQKDPTKPFYVTVNSPNGLKQGTELKVLGTHFNVTAYENEETITTTLMEGSVQVSNNSTSALLSPGQQAVLTNKPDIEIKNNINTEDIRNHTKGIYKFDKASAKTIMQQVERMYDVKADYHGKMPDNLHITLYQSETLSELIDALNETDEISCELIGRTISVKPKVKPQP